MGIEGGSSGGEVQSSEVRTSSAEQIEQNAAEHESSGEQLEANATMGDNYGEQKQIDGGSDAEDSEPDTQGESTLDANDSIEADGEMQAENSETGNPEAEDAEAGTDEEADEGDRGKSLDDNAQIEDEEEKSEENAENPANPETTEETSEIQESRLDDFKQRMSDVQNKIDSFLKKDAPESKEMKDAQKMVDDYVNKDLSNVVSKDKKDVRMKDTVVFEDANKFDKELVKRGCAPGESARINGFNDGEKSHVKDSGPHPVKTAIHEHNHQLSSNDVKDANGNITETRRGISINGKDTQANEGLTEMYTKKMMGAEYPQSPNVNYLDNMHRMEKMENGFGSDLMKEAYYQNKPELLENKFDSVMGKGEWNKLSEAMDKSLDPKASYADRIMAGKDADYLSDVFVRKTGGNP